MPYNLDLYPTDFPSSQVGVGPSVTDLAIQDLQIQAEATAVRQAQLRRAQGRGTATLQNSATSVLNSLMPTNVVGGAAPAVVYGTKGFWLGGCLYGLAPAITVDRLTYNNESVSSIGSALTTGKWAMAGASSAVNGYSAGGTVSTGVIDRLVFATEVVSTLAATLASQRWEVSGVASPTNAYFAGGYIIPAGTSTIIDRLVFATEAVNTLGATLSSIRASATSGASTTNAYFMGGFTGSTPGSISSAVAVIDRLLFSGETTSTLGATLTRAKGGGAGVGSSVNAYTGGGYTGADPIATIDRFAFGTETASSLGAVLSIVRFFATGVSSSVNGYMGGGVNRPGWNVTFSVIDRLVFSGESVAPIGATLSAARFESAAISNYAYSVAGT